MNYPAPKRCTSGYCVKEYEVQRLQLLRFMLMGIELLKQMDQELKMGDIEGMRARNSVSVVIRFKTLILPEKT